MDAILTDLTFESQAQAIPTKDLPPEHCQIVGELGLMHNHPILTPGWQFKRRIGTGGFASVYTVTNTRDTEL